MKFILTFLLALLGFHAYANTEIPDHIPTPNASSLGSFGIVPVSQYTGKPMISIPLYTFSNKGMSLPVSLDYDGSGVKVNELPGWVGQNWSINAGGVITRSIRGKVDESHFKTLRLSEYYLDALEYARSIGTVSSDFFDRFEITYPNFFENYQNLAYPNFKCMDNVTNAFLSDVVDNSSDVYFFNFLNYSGYFFLNHDGQWKVQSESNLDIIFDIRDQSNFIAPFIPKFYNGKDMDKTIKGFTIRDDKGYKYEFGGTTDAIEYTTPFFDMGQWTAMSWYLSKITDKFGKVIYTFEYERGRYLVQVHHHEEDNKVTFKNPNLKFINTQQYGQEILKLSFHFNAPVYLTKITASNGIIGEFKSCDNEDKDENYHDYMAFNRLYERLFNLLKDEKLGYGQYYQGLRERAQHDLDSYDYIRMKDKPFAYLFDLYYNETKQYDIWEKCIYIPSNRRNTFDLGYIPNYEPIANSEQAIYKDDILSRTRTRKLEYFRVRHEDENVDTGQGIGYRFKYQYSGRMHLSKIVVTTPWGAEASAGDFSALGVYSFKYDHFGEIPFDLITPSDAWGYYNGNNFLSIEDPNFRAPNPNYATLGSLKEIQYPTGGTTEFEFELNQYGSYLNDNKTAVEKCSTTYGGGLRIASITNWDSPIHNKLLNKKIYSYTFPNSNQSSGIISCRPRFIWNKWKGNLVLDNGTCEYTIKRNNSILPLVNSYGPNLGYSCVKETNLDGSYTINWYTNMSDIDHQDERYFEEYGNNGDATPFDIAHSNKSFMRGKLRLSSNYDLNNNKVKSTGYIYRPFEDFKNAFETMSGYSLKASTYTYDLGKDFSGNPYWYTDQYFLVSGGLYKLYYSKCDLLQVNDTIFEKNGNYIVQTRYNKNDKTLRLSKPYSHYSNIRVLTSKEIVCGDQSCKDVYKYENEYDSPLYSQYFCIIPTCTTNYINGIFTKSNQTIFGFSNSNKFYLPQKEQEKTSENGLYVDNIIYDAYNDDGNLIQYSYNGVSTHLEWDKDGNNITEVKKGNLCTSYEYNKLFGLKAVWFPDRHGIQYEYDISGRLVCEKEQGQKKNSYTYHYRDPRENPLVDNETYNRTPKTCSVSIGTSSKIFRKVSSFEIVRFPQKVDIDLEMFTNQQSTYAEVLISCENNSFSKKFYINDRIQKRYEQVSIELKPGTYTISAFMQNIYLKTNSTEVNVCVSYKKLSE